MRCPVCEEEILPDQGVQRIPAPQRVRLGPKSGLPGLYPHEAYETDQEEDVVHYPSCCMGYFDLEGNPYIYDAVFAEVSEKLEDELRDDLRKELRKELTADLERVKQQLGSKNFNFCVECWAEIEDPQEPPCLWCKSNDWVWSRSTPQGQLHYCTRCVKMWNDQEEELAA